MKKSIAIGLTLLFIVSMAGCSLYGVASDYPAAIMVGDTVYYLTSQAMPAEIDESAVIGYTESYTDVFPKENNATNFSRFVIASSFVVLMAAPPFRPLSSPAESRLASPRCMQ